MRCKCNLYKTDLDPRYIYIPSHFVYCPLRDTERRGMDARMYLTKAEEPDFVTPEECQECECKMYHALKRWCPKFVPSHRKHLISKDFQVKA